MNAKTFKTILLKTGFVASVLLLASGPSFAVDSTVELGAAPQSTTLPDGQTVPMWGYTCGDSAAIPIASVNATCTAMNGALQAGGMTWQPPLITVPSGNTLKINLTNNLTFPLGPNTIPTSLVIVGQLGGGLGTLRSTVASPPHAAQGTTWPGTPGGAGSCPSDGTFCPPAQPDRVVSLATEVAVGLPQVLEWKNLRAGTYLIHSGTHPSIQHPMGLYAVLVVTDASYPGTGFDKDVALLFSEIDPVQNAAVDKAVNTAGFDMTKPWNGQTNECGDPNAPAANTCYPPAVNYDPRYYLINGVSYDRTNLPASTFAGPGATALAGKGGNVLLRLVNAGLRMHVPSVVGRNMTLYAEDGNVLPGIPKVQTQVFLAAGKTYDVTIKPATTLAPTASVDGSYADATYAVFDRQLSLSTNNQRDGGMQAYIKVAAGAASGVGTAAGSGTTLSAGAPKTYYCVAGTALDVSDPAKGVLAGMGGANGAALNVFTAANGLDTLSFQGNGTFTYTPSSPTNTTCGGTISFNVNASTPMTASIVQCDATSSVLACSLGGAPTANADTYSSKIASRLQITPPGVLSNDTDPSGLPLKAVFDSIGSCASVQLNTDGSFVAKPSSPGTSCTFTYHAVNSQNTASPTTANSTCVSSGSPFPWCTGLGTGTSTGTTATLTFQTASGLVVNLKDGKTGLPLPVALANDYRWIIEEDRTVYINPNIETTGGTPPRNAAINFHVSHMPVVAQGCVGPISCESGQTLLQQPAICDIGNGSCRTTELDGITALTTSTAVKAQVTPGEVALDPNKRYYISILPGDGWITGGGDCDKSAVADPNCGHTMGGAQIAPAQTSVNVFLQTTPLETAKVSVFVFQDDAPLNGENDSGGGVDVLAPNEPGLGGFNIVLLDQAGGFGDSSGQLTYDMFGNPVTNALAGTINPITGNDACPITQKADGLVGMIVTCPKYESDGKTLSALAGHALIANMYPGLYEVFATAGADRIARGEEWLQTNTLDGTKAIEAFLKAGEPGYFQEFGPGGFHVAVGFANPKIITDRKAGVCANQTCSATINGLVTATRMSRTPDQRVYSSGSYDAYSFTQCYVSLGAPDGADFDFAKCNADGTFQFSGIPKGDLRVTVFDQYNDLLVDGLSTPVKVDGEVIGTTENPLQIPVTQWRTNLYGRIFLDTGNCSDESGPGHAGDGVSQSCEPGLPLVPFNIRYRDGSYAGFNNTDLAGYAGFNEVFPFLNWLVVDTDSARYKLTGVHVVYDAGGPVDGTTGGGTSNIGHYLANTKESPTAHLPTDLRVPGARYCALADCATGDTAGGSTGRVDPGWASTQGWQGLLGQNSFIEFAMKPFAAGENGGIRGHVVYMSTRPFDDPALLLQLSWQPGVANVKVNLYQEGTAADGSKTLKLVDTTTSTSWDDWAQGFRRDANGNVVFSGGKAVPNMSCPGQEVGSPFYFTMAGGTTYLNPTTAMAQDGRFRCYDGWSMLNQVQPAPYNGMYKFPSVAAKSTATGQLPTGEEGTNWFLQLDPTTFKTNCTICVTGPDGTPMLPAGKYVVEVIVPQGYELVKEEDRNILMGDAYSGPAVTQFAGYGNIFIMPDQAAIGSLYNRTNTLQRTNNNGAVPRREGDTGSAEVFWPCVGATRIVPDLASLFPGAGQQSAFAGASRQLCDRKEITLENQMTALAKFYIYSSTHIAGHFTGAVTNDFASEFDPFSPQFGEKFAMPNVPVAIKDFSGKEVSRVYTDQWGIYNGLNFSTWSVWPPSPSGYIPQMMIACMNDPGPIPDPANAGKMITDPAYNPAYSNFCYEIPFMPGQTAYLDTPVIPTMAHAAGYNLPDCEYPDTTPAIKSVIGNDTSNVVVGSSGKGPWVSGVDDSTSVISLALAASGFGGTGYTSVPIVSIAAAPPGGSNATGTATMNVNAVVLSNAGLGYISRPTTNFSAGSALAANTTLTGTFLSVTNIVRSAGGSGYTIANPPTVALTPPTCTISVPTCVQATATANVSGGAVVSFTMTNIGAGYTARPTATIACSLPCTGTGAAASNGTNSNTTGTFMSINRVVLSNNGTGYTTRPTATFNCTTGCSTNIPGGPGGTRALATNAATTGAFLSVNALALGSGGVGYTSAPAVTIDPPASGTTATAAATLGTNVHHLTIAALGDKQVLNHAYSGPQATSAPYNKKFITRHYGFGTQCTAIGSACTAISSVTIGGVNAPVISWGDTQIVVGVPSIPPGLSGAGVGSTCGAGANQTPYQRTTPAAVGTSARCGQLEITAGNGKKSIDTVTVTVAGKPPKYITPSSPSEATRFGNITRNALQYAIDQAAPGDLILVGPDTPGDTAVFNENLLMWKPIRLQGVAAESVIINADAHPAGKMDAWRRQVNCLFGMALNGRPLLFDGTFSAEPYDASGTYTCPTDMQQRVDRIPFESIVGWDTTGNGNLAQMLQEPTLMGAYEGAGVTVLGRGIRIPNASNDFWGASNAGGFPAGYSYLTTGGPDCTALPLTTNGRDYGSSNFLCNPSRIDGISVINSSQGGGAIFAHGWNHKLEVANTRVHGNHGTLTGGITIGNGEFPDPFVCDAAALDGTSPLPAGLPGLPAACNNNADLGVQLGYGFNQNTKVHHNSVTANASIGDALFSGTPSAAGGVTFCVGSDGYKFNNNWICGNLSTGDAGGVAHSGFINDGLIQNNQILFNQSASPTIPTNGGGLAILGASPDRTLANGVECGNQSDQDCPPGLAEGTGRNLVINANLIMGNSAESGTGGGIRLQMVNGLDVTTFPTNSTRWNDVTITNNIIANNIAGWDGGGVSLQDALHVKFINNTVMSNDTTASAGVLFNTLGAPTAAVPPPGCTPESDPTLPQNPNCSNPVKTSTNQVAGLVAMPNTPNLTAALTGVPVLCPLGYGYFSEGSDGECRRVSFPLLLNNVFWQNRAFHVGVTAPTNGAADLQGQSSTVTLYPQLNQTVTGECAVTPGTPDPFAPGSPAGGVNYWDIGVRGDSGPNNHGSGYKLVPRSSILSAGDYTGNGNLIGSNPAVASQYCNGARIPPERCIGVTDPLEVARCKGYYAPPGHSEFTGLPPVFKLNQTVVAATVDEGNNWINLSYGPLALNNSSSYTTPGIALAPLGDYSITAGSPAINAGANATTPAGVGGVPTTDFFGRTRPLTVANPADIGAVEFVLAGAAAASVSPGAVDFGNVAPSGNTSRTLTLHNNGTGGLSSIVVTVAGTDFARSIPTPGTCGTTLGTGLTCTINIVFTAPGTPGVSTGTVTIATTEATVSGSPVELTGTSAAAPVVSVTGGPLAFTSQTVGTTSAPKTLTVSNTGGSAFTGITVTFPGGSAYSRPAGLDGGTCGETLAAGGSCTIEVVFRPLAVSGTNSSNVAITGNVAVSGSAVSLSGVSTAPVIPTLSVLDNFNRANTTGAGLGANWSQPNSNIRINANQALENGTNGNAYWNGTAGGGPTYGARQAAAFTFANTTVTGDNVILKASGGTATAPANFIRVRMNSTTSVVVETTTNSGGAFTIQGTLTSGTAYANGNTLTAMVDENGVVYVYRNTTFVGAVQLPTDTLLWSTDDGRIGIRLQTSGARVDNFAGGTVP